MSLSKFPRPQPDPPSDDDDDDTPGFRLPPGLIPGMPNVRRTMNCAATEDFEFLAKFARIRGDLGIAEAAEKLDMLEKLDVSDEAKKEAMERGMELLRAEARAKNARWGNDQGARDPGVL